MAPDPPPEPARGPAAAVPPQQHAQHAQQQHAQQQQQQQQQQFRGRRAPPQQQFYAPQYMPPHAYAPGPPMGYGSYAHPGAPHPGPYYAMPSMGGMAPRGAMPPQPDHTQQQQQQQQAQQQSQQQPQPPAHGAWVQGAPRPHFGGPQRMHNQHNMGQPNQMGAQPHMQQPMGVPMPHPSAGMPQQGMQSHHQAYVNQQKPKGTHGMVAGGGHHPGMMGVQSQHMGQGAHEGPVRNQPPHQPQQASMPPQQRLTPTVPKTPIAREKKILKIMRPDGSEVKPPTPVPSSASRPTSSAKSPASAALSTPADAPMPSGNTPAAKSTPARAPVQAQSSQTQASTPLQAKDSLQGGTRPQQPSPAATPSKALPIVAPPTNQASAITKPPAPVSTTASKATAMKDGEAEKPAQAAPEAAKDVVDIAADAKAAAEDAKAAAKDAQDAASVACAAAADVPTGLTVSNLAKPAVPNGVLSGTTVDGVSMSASKGVKTLESTKTQNGMVSGTESASALVRNSPENTKERKSVPSNTNTSVSLAVGTAVTAVPMNTAATAGEAEKVKDSKSAGATEASPVESVTKASQESADKPAKEGVEELGDESKDDAPASPKRRQRPPSIKFKDGERRRYHLEFMFGMREFPSSDVAATFDAALMSASLSKLRGGGATGAGGGERDDPRNRNPGPARGMFANGPDHANMRGGPRGGMTFPGMGMNQRPVTRPPPGAVPGAASGYDAFDLASARTRALPPGGQAGANGRSGDPRGTGQLAPLPDGRRGGGSGRFDGPSRGGMGPLDAFQAIAPVEKLVKGQNAWARSKENDDDITAKVKQVRSHLNKLTLEKFDKIFNLILGLDISNIDVLKGIVNEIFEKTLAEPMFAGMYSELCRRLNKHYDESGVHYTDAEGRALTFRKVLLGNCQNEFMRFKAKTEEHAASLGDTQAVGNGEEAKPTAELDDDAKRAKAKAEKEAMQAKKRMLGNVRFIGELYKKDLLAEKIVHEKCIVELLKLAIQGREEDVIEALCSLLSRTGKKLSENPDKNAKEQMNKYFDRLRSLSMDHRLPARVRFMLQDLAEQRKNGWNLRRDDQSAKTISEIKEDIKKEERAKEQAQQQARSGRGGGGRSGGGFSRDRAPPHVSAPRMTMASANRQSSGNRATNMLEKYANRSGSGGPATGAAPRLGPRSRTAGWNSGGGTSLRPGGGSRFASNNGGGGPAPTSNAFAALSMDGDDNSGSGDVRVATNRLSGRGNRSSVPRSGSGEPRAAAPAAKPEVKLMPHDKLKQKTSSIVREFFELQDLKEARECVVDEVKEVNYTNFVTEMLRLCLEAKVVDRPKCVPLFEGLLTSPISVSMMKDGVTPLLSSISDLEMDDPKASFTIAMYIGAMGATGKFVEAEAVNDTYGLNFLKEPLMKIEDKKKAMKLAVLCYAALEKKLVAKEADESKRQSDVRSALTYVGLDLPAMALEHNPMRGLDSLKDLLKDNKAQFLVPLLPLEADLPAKLDTVKSPEEIVTFVEGCIPASMIGSEGLARVLVRLCLAWAFKDQSVDNDVLERFGKTCGPAIKRLLQLDDDNSPAESTQMTLVLDTQVWLHKAASDPSLTRIMSRATFIAFNCLYDVEVVEEDLFRMWKKDTKESQALPGKQKALLQSSKFFEWLDKAVEED